MQDAHLVKTALLVKIMKFKKIVKSVRTALALMQALIWVLSKDIRWLAKSLWMTST